MFRISIVVALLLLTQTIIASASMECAGAGPAILSVTVTGVDHDGGLNRYHIRGTVENVGSASEASNTLQSVDIFKGSEKLDAKSVPPLKPGQSYAFSYVSARSADAGKGTTTLTFQLHVRPSLRNCNAHNQRYTVTF